MRAFIAIKLPLEIKDCLAKVQDKLKTTLPKINWVNPSNLHLSLKFLGEISSEQLQNSQQIIAQIAKTTQPFKITLETLGVFPDYQAARIIWIGTAQAPCGFKQLVEQLDKRLLAPNLPPEQCAFQAHITLGRIKAPLHHSVLEKVLRSLENEVTAMNLKFDCRSIALFQSVLGLNGPVYSILNEEFF